MRHIHVMPGLRLRFAGRNETFNEGVEIGLLAAQLASGIAEFTMTLAASTTDHARVLATNMGYRLHVTTMNEGAVEIIFITGSRRPKLELVCNKLLARSSFLFPLTKIYSARSAGAISSIENAQQRQSELFLAFERWRSARRYADDRCGTSHAEAADRGWPV
jgi:hypothetical protein